MSLRDLSVGALVAIFLSSAAWGASSTLTGLPAALDTAVKTALADIGKARTALNGGNSKTSQSYLAKSEALLGSVLGSPANSGSTEKSLLARIEDISQKVTLVRSLLQAGKASEAKSLLNQIPSSPLGLLRSASGL
jgi:hypothetical protein